MKIKLKYIGHHSPREVVEVSAKLVKGLLESKMYELVDKPKEVKINKQVKSLKVDKPKDDLDVKVFD